MASKSDAKFADIQREVAAYCSEHGDPVLVAKYSRYFREGYDAYGLSEEKVHTLRDNISSKYNLNCKEIIRLGEQLLQPGKYEYGTVAILLLMKQTAAYDADTLQGVKSWFDSGVNNWAHSDILCSRVTPVFLEKGIAPLESFASWRKAESRWTRRAVPVTMLCLRKTANPQELLSFLNPMMDDAERVVHQGLGWFLRELWKLHPQPVEDFLLQHKNHCARLIIQYATEKMTSEHKLRFRKDKIKKGLI